MSAKKNEEENSYLPIFSTNIPGYLLKDYMTVNIEYIQSQINPLYTCGM